MTINPPTGEAIRARLLEVAKALFLERGIQATEMRQVASEAGLSRSTLYRYCSDKNQLIFQVCTQVIIEFTEMSYRFDVVPGMTGFDKLCLFSRNMVRVLAEHPAIPKFLNEFDRLFAGDYPDIPEAQQYVTLMNRLMNRHAQFLFEGMADGSIRKLERPLLSISVLLNTCLSLAERLLPRDSHYREEHHAGSMEIIDEALRILLESVRA